MSQELQKAEKAERAMEYIPFGAESKIKLSIAIVKNLLAVPTKSGRTCSDRDATKFMMLCSAKGLNPFDGDAYLVGYDSVIGGSVVPTFTQITAHQAFLKRAEIHPSYDGMKSGIILLVDEETSQTLDREGDFHLPDENVVGGWATVFLKGRSVPVHRRVRMARFNRGHGVWKEDPAGMIVKCAEADALRSAFPTKIGGLYLRDEMSFPVNVDSQGPELTRLIESSPPPAPPPALPPTRTAAAGPPVPETPPEVVAEPEPPAAEAAEEKEPEPEPPAAPQSPAVSAPAQNALAHFIVSEGYDFRAFQMWAYETGNIPGIEKMRSFDQVSEADAKRLLRSKTGVLKGLALTKAGTV